MTGKTEKKTAAGSIGKFSANRCEKRKKSRIWRRICTSAIVLTTVSLMFALTGCGFSGANAGSDSVYLPSLEVMGDVNSCIKLQADAAGNIIGSIVETAASVDKETDDESEMSAKNESQIKFELQKFTTDYGEYTGILISDVLDASGITAADSTMYLRGRDGMLACMAVSQLDKNYLVFGKNGWEAVSIDCPPSIDVKELADIVIVADDPSQVSAAVTVNDENGTARTISPGTLILKTQSSELEYQGQSEKNGIQVSVLLTDRYVKVGDSKLTLEGNRIIVN